MNNCQKISSEKLQKLLNEYRLFSYWNLEQPKKQTALMILGLRG